MVAGLIAVGAAILISEPFSSTPPAPVDLPPELADEPDLYMKDAVITQYQPSGGMKYELHSTRIRHFERDNLTRLLQPILTLHNTTAPPWKITAEHGYIKHAAAAGSAGEEVVFLRNSVALEQRYSDGRRVRVESPSLYIYPDREYAETEQAVMIDTDVGRTTAVGLRGDLQRGLLELSTSAQQRVHTIVLPGQFK